MAFIDEHRARFGVEPAYAKRLGAVGGQQTRSGPDDVGCYAALSG